jgi:hypothetical protein
MVETLHGEVSSCREPFGSREGARGLNLVTVEGGCQVIGQESLRSKGGQSGFSVENSRSRENHRI